MRRTMFMLLFVLCVSLLLGTEKTALTASAELEKDIPEIEQQLRDYGVSENDVVKLIDKLRRGEVWDSMKPEYQDLKPQIVAENYEKTIYPDGSVAVQTYEPISSKATDDGMTSLSIVNKKGIRVKRSIVLLTLEFKVNYSRDTSTGRAKITSQYGKAYYVVGGTAKEDTSGFKKGWLNPTHAWYAVNYTGYQNVSAGRYWVKIFVNGNGKWEESNF
ncbi:Uncharacterised protein [Aedoeadaptatus ivorii]|uniref:Uncharacterized protein n=1 Tax=Aedoeadaptatus ivorii TaxID=54006 RepID=A0A3S5BWH1_9FIRM|nr:hypothetical protein [Peptoniphilus ivorii]VEJ36062.1 Uncharacterised protein [Peptoniphilus ivorii]